MKNEGLQQGKENRIGNKTMEEKKLRTGYTTGTCAAAAAKAAARAAGTAIAAERSKRNKRCAELYREKSEAKKEARGSSCRDMIIPECPTQSECNAFNDRYEKMKRFAEARKAYDDECHQGGDKGHQEQSKGWNEGAQNCKNKYDECITKLNKLI